VFRRLAVRIGGIASAIADDAALGNVAYAFAGIALLAWFVLGAACSAVLINWGRRRHLNSRYALPLLLEAFLLLCFGLPGGHLAMFLSGGLTGALGFKHVGYAATILLAGILVVLATVPMVDDLSERARRPGSSVR
jgi:hypothetical protein